MDILLNLYIIVIAQTGQVWSSPKFTVSEVHAPAERLNGWELDSEYKNDKKFQLKCYKQKFEVSSLFGRVSKDYHSANAKYEYRAELYEPENNEAIATLAFGDCSDVTNFNEKLGFVVDDSSGEKHIEMRILKNKGWKECKLPRAVDCSNKCHKKLKCQPIRSGNPNVGSQWRLEEKNCEEAYDEKYGYEHEQYKEPPGLEVKINHEDDSYILNAEEYYHEKYGYEHEHYEEVTELEEEKYKEEKAGHTLNADEYYDEKYGCDHEHYAEPPELEEEIYSDKRDAMARGWEEGPITSEERRHHNEEGMSNQNSHEEDYHESHGYEQGQYKDPQGHGYEKEKYDESWKEDLGVVNVGRHDDESEGSWSVGPSTAIPLGIVADSYEN